jgi:lysozyme
MKTLSIEGLKLIKEFEGLRLKAYLDPVNIPTIGIGTTIYPTGIKVKLGDTITEKQAEEFLLHDLEVFHSCLKRAITAPVTQNQADALLSWCYNVGCGAATGSTLIKKHNAGDFKGAAEEFLRWNKAGGKVLPGLTRRREAERKLYLTSVVSGEPAKILISKADVMAWQKSVGLVPDGVIGKASWKLIVQRGRQ